MLDRTGKDVRLGHNGGQVGNPGGGLAEGRRKDAREGAQRGLATPTGAPACSRSSSSALIASASPRGPVRLPELPDAVAAGLVDGEDVIGGANGGRPWRYRSGRPGLAEEIVATRLHRKRHHRLTGRHPCDRAAVDADAAVVGPPVKVELSDDGGAVRRHRPGSHVLVEKAVRQQRRRWDGVPGRRTRARRRHRSSRRRPSSYRR